MKTSRLLLIAIMLTAAVTAGYAETLDNLRQKAEQLHAEGKNDSALLVAEKALEIAVPDNDTTAIIGLNSSMGVYLRTLGRLDEALKHYNTAMRLCTTDAFKRNADEEQGRKQPRSTSTWQHCTWTCSIRTTPFTTPNWLPTGA